MASDDTQLNSGSGGETIRSLSDGTINWPVGVTAYATTISAGANVLQIVTAAAGLPVQPQTGSTWAATQSGTWTVQPGNTANTTAWLVTGTGGTFPATQSGTWNVTNISGTVSLPTGAATAAKQPALGTAGTASADVITVQGIASMTALKVDGSAVTQPVSGTVTATLGNSTNAGATVKTLDYDTGAGTDTVTGFGVLLPASGGAVAGGTATNPLQVSLANTAANATAVKVDGSAVTQPVSGTVTVTQATGTNLHTVIDSGTVTTVSTVTSLSQFAGNAIDTNSGLKSAGTLRVVLATDQPALTNKLLVTPDANSAVNVAQMNGVTVTMGNGVSGTGVQRVTIASDSTGVIGATQSGTWTVQPGNTANTTAWLVTGTGGTFPATQSGTWTVQPGNTANTTPWLVTDTPATSGGLSQSHVTSAASNNKTAVKASAGQLYMISAQNVNAAARYLKVFDKTSANVTAGTTAADYQFTIPGNTAGAGLVLNIDKGIAHANAITIMITGGAALTDNTSISANDVTLTIGYK